jgi:hypothetical protein
MADAGLLAHDFFGCSSPRLGGSFHRHVAHQSPALLSRLGLGIVVAWFRAKCAEWPTFLSVTTPGGGPGGGRTLRRRGGTGARLGPVDAGREQNCCWTWRRGG